MRLASFLLPVLFLVQTCLAQTPTIGFVEVYGTRKTSPADIRKMAGVSAGGRLPASKAVVEDALEQIALVESAFLEAACCEAGKLILYIGIAEEGQPTLTFREAPVEGPDIPDAVTAAYRNFLDRVNEASRAGISGEDLSQGHSLMEYGPAREAQTAFVALAKQYRTELKEVIAKSSSEDHRAMAAYVLGYYEDKAAVIDDLAYALRDSDPTVRGNAARALAAIAVYSERNPGAGVRVDTSLFSSMLHSPVWTDRNNAAVALVTLTQSRRPDVLRALRQETLPALVEMARWRHLPHALPAYILLGRTAGIPEAELQAAWTKGERDRIIARASGTTTLPRAKPSGTKSAAPSRP